MLREKTTWAGILAGIAAVGGIITGDLTVAQGLPGLLSALIGIFCKDR